MLMFNLALIAPSSSKVLAQDTRTRSQQATPTSQPTRTQRATPTSDTPKEPIAIFVQEKVLLNEEITETTGRQRENTYPVEDEINPLPLNNQILTVKEKIEIFVAEDEASAKTEAANNVESDCAIQSGGRSSFSAFGLLLTPLLLHIWRRVRNS